jgi:hypothetical protein
MYTKTNKEIYRFKVFLEEEIEKQVDVEKKVEVEKDVEVEKTRKNAEGQEEKYVETEKQKVTETQIVQETRKEKENAPYSFVIKQPTRRQMEEADMEYSIEMSRCVKDGILTKAMLLNKYSDTGGIMSEAEAKALAEMYGRLGQLQTEFTSWKISDKNKFSDKQKETVEEMAQLRRDIAKTETNFSALLNHTADSKAQTKVISWYLLSLTNLENEKGELEPYFKGDTFDDKLNYLYDLEEDEDPLLDLVYDKLTAFVSFWYFSVSATKEDFENLEKDIEEGTL